MPIWKEKIDLSEKTNLQADEKNEIASVLHALLINEFYAHRSWTTHQAVFHGGTALALLYNSGRFSEDLDFMVSEEVYSNLAKAMKSARAKVNAAIQKIYPGSEIDLTGPKGDTVQSWMFGWTHPNRRGKVKVKVEFLETPLQYLQHYKTSQLSIGPDRPSLANLTSSVTGPKYVSSWADKIVAMAERPVFKWRDVYDLAFLRTRIANNNTSAEAKIDALRANIDIYGSSLEKLRDGLNARLEAGIFDDLDEYTRSMFEWVPEGTWKGWMSSGSFQQQLSEAKDEVIETVHHIDELIAQSSARP